MVDIRRGSCGLAARIHKNVVDVKNLALLATHIQKLRADSKKGTAKISNDLKTLFFQLFKGFKHEVSLVIILLRPLLTNLFSHTQ